MIHWKRNAVRIELLVILNYIILHLYITLVQTVTHSPSMVVTENNTGRALPATIIGVVVVVLFLVIMVVITIIIIISLLVIRRHRAKCTKDSDSV